MKLPPLNQNWRSVFGADQKIQRVRPRASDADILNPHRGTTTFQRFNGDPLYPGNRWSDRLGPEEFGPPPASLHNDRYPDTTISYCRWAWSVLEPEKNKFRWELIDGALRAAAQRGQTLQVRIQPYVGDAHWPAWVENVGIHVPPPAPYPMNPNPPYAPDHNSESYIRHFGDMIRAFGQRYDGHPDLESFDVAYGGGCGETGGNATCETAQRLVDIYVDAFRKTQLITMLGTPGCRHAATLKDRAIGWRADCFGDVSTGEWGEAALPKDQRWTHMYDLYAMEVAQCKVADAWKTAPITLETCWVVGTWFEKGWDVDWILEQGLNYHTSVFMPKSCYIPEEWADKIAAFNRKLGYRFVLRQLKLPLQARPGEMFETDVFIDNMGVAPIYRPYQLALRFRQGEQQEVVPLQEDIRKWLPGGHWFTEPLTFPKSLQPGVVAVDLGIIDPLTKEARVQLANEGVLEDRWHPMTHMDVVA